MAQNVSNAVMQTRIEPRDSLDDFPTPSWAVRALIAHIIQPIESRSLKDLCVWEPAANRGYMVRGLKDYFGRVWASDIRDYGAAETLRHDFLESRMLSLGIGVGLRDSDWIITNPPFRLGAKFIDRARYVATRGVAMIVRSAFLEGGERYEQLFSRNPPSIIAQHCERVIMTKGIVRDPSKEYWDEAACKMRRPSTATSYCWLIWCSEQIWSSRVAAGTKFMWIPPCRKQMERPGDYPE